MFRTSIVCSLGMALIVAATGCSPTFDQEAITHDFDGTMSFDSTKAQDAVTLKDQNGQTGTLSTGPAHVHMEYQWGHWSDEHEPDTYTQASMVLTIGASTYTFAMPDNHTGFMDQTLYVAAADSGQPSTIQLSSQSTEVDTWTTQVRGTCSIPGCTGNGCIGSTDTITTHVKHRRDMTITIGMPGSTETAFVTGATFAGQEYYETTSDSTGSCN